MSVTSVFLHLLNRVISLLKTVADKKGPSRQTILKGPSRQTILKAVIANN